MSIPIDSDGNLVLPEGNDPAWAVTALQELASRLQILEEYLSDESYNLHGECMMIVAGLLEYHGEGL